MVCQAHQQPNIRQTRARCVNVALCSMSQSLSPRCTPLKQNYDSCFNSWFEGYLEPAIAASSTPEQRSAHSKQKANEFQENCGKIWEKYKACVQVRAGKLCLLSHYHSSSYQEAVKEKGLDKLLQQAREENPLVDPIPEPSVPPTKR